LFSDAHYGFRNRGSTAEILTMISNRISCVLDDSGEARAIALDIFKAVEKVCRIFEIIIFRWL